MTRYSYTQLGVNVGGSSAGNRSMGERWTVRFLCAARRSRHDGLASPMQIWAILFGPGCPVRLSFYLVLFAGTWSVVLWSGCYPGSKGLLNCLQISIVFVTPIACLQSILFIGSFVWRLSNKWGRRNKKEGKEKKRNKI
jgi:hypothetical protein